MSENILSPPCAIFWPTQHVLEQRPTWVYHFKKKTVAKTGRKGDYLEYATFLILNKRGKCPFRLIKFLQFENG